MSKLKNNNSNQSITDHFIDVSTSETPVGNKIKNTSTSDGSASSPTAPVRNKNFIDRELSWLAFNQRVLEESVSPRHPILERLRFLAISDNNLDEFLMVRVAGMISQIKLNISEPTLTGWNTREQFTHVMDKVKSLFMQQKTNLHLLLKEMQEKHHITIIDRHQCKNEDKKKLEKVFFNEIFTALTPLTLDPMHPFPFIPNKSIVLAFEMQHHADMRHMRALLVVPRKLRRFIICDWHRDKHVYITIEELILMFADHIFTGFDITDHGVLRIIRDSNLEYYEEADDQATNFADLLKKRRFGRIVHMRYHGHLSDEFMRLLEDEMDIEQEDYIYSDMMLALSDLQRIIGKLPINLSEKLCYPKIDVRWPKRLEYFKNNCFEAIKHKDFVVHHPYEDFGVVLAFLHQAAMDENVVAIKQTLYRTSNDSPIVDALILAAEKGKTVTALVELKARFDEEANLRWARDLEKAGVQVVYGFADLKTHAKASIVIRNEGRHMRTYMHFGTGNYHPITAKNYTDLSLFTCDESFAQDATDLFNYMTGYAKPTNLKSIKPAPILLRKTLVAHLHQEIENAKSGQPAWVVIKINNLVDPDIIREFYKAAQAGVKIDLIVRSICCLRPQVKGLSDNISVRSIVGRFLEHTRIYVFANGQTDLHDDNIVYMSSADLMSRNLDRRVELAIPIHNSTVKHQILDEIISANLRDEANCWIMTSDGQYHRHPNAQSEKAFCAQSYFITHQSLSGTLYDSDDMLKEIEHEHL